MTLTLLLDLDNTLLGNDMEVFVPAYLQALSRCMAQHTDPSSMVKNLMAATRQMIEAPQPERTLRQTFDAAFFPALGLPRAEVQATLDAFYSREFPQLQRLTHPRPEAVKLVEAAFSRGYRVGIATNPLFPLSAIVQRLAWAGLSPRDYPFALIPSYETFHFAKPHPAYYAELLAQMGWPDGPVLMAGDDPANDIAPARRLELPTYWVSDGPALSHGPDPEHARFAQRKLREGEGAAKGRPAAVETTASGALTGLLPWLDATDPEALQPQFDTPAALLAILRATPAALDTLTTRLTAGDWQRRPQPAEWCAAEILCHLRDVDAEVNLPRLQKVMQETNPFIPGQDTDRWAGERRYCDQEGGLALQAFITSRKELLALLDTLTPPDWQRPVRHAIFVPTHLHELVRIIAGHDRLHVRQAHGALQPTHSTSDI